MSNQAPSPSAELLEPENVHPEVAPLVSFLCVTRNRREMVLKCLASCEAQTHRPTEMVVIDNASEDGTAEAIRERFPDVVLIRTHRNIGFFPALNLAIANARGEYLMTVDDDAYFLHDDAVAEMVAEFRRDPAVGGVTCNIEGPHEASPTRQDRDVGGFKTGFAMLPRKVFTEWIGFYPDVFFRSAGETFVCTALWDMGRRFRQLAGVRMYHAQAMQGRSVWAWSFYGLRSQLLVCFMRDPWYILPVRLAGKFFSSLAHAVRRRRFLAWAAAWAQVWYHVPMALRQRQAVRGRTFWHVQRLKRLDPNRDG